MASFSFLALIIMCKYGPIFGLSSLLTFRNNTSFYTWYYFCLFFYAIYYGYIYGSQSIKINIHIYFLIKFQSKLISFDFQSLLTIMNIFLHTLKDWIWVCCFFFYTIRLYIYIYARTLLTQFYICIYIHACKKHITCNELSLAIRAIDRYKSNRLI